ncbi:hypothetical protein MMC22_007078 [Lobaria immixta]|nr:hypothetical protein [Lobaria immixta]
MTIILLENSIHLTSLWYVGNELAHNEKFYEALANQSSLQCLQLRQEPEERERQRPEVTDFLVESLSELVNLRALHVMGMPASFTELHIMELAHNLPKLKVWTIGVRGLTDKVWGAIASLRSLRRLNFGHRENFTADGNLDFIEKLGPGNKGLIVSGSGPRRIVKTRILEEEEQKSIQDNITKKVNGRFLLRQGK